MAFPFLGGAGTLLSALGHEPLVKTLSFPGFHPDRRQRIPARWLR